MDGEILAIITVLEFPPSESFNILVNLESLYGTKVPFFFLSPNALIQFANESKEVLIFAPSRSLIPLFFVTVPLSDPAKSISDNFPSSLENRRPLVLGVEDTVIWNTACDREEVLLISVDSVLLLLLPI